MKSILKKVAGIAICAVLALGMIGCSAESEDNLALLGILGGSGSSHEHTFADEWTSDATHHWHAATCAHTAEVKDKAEHTFGEWNITAQPREDAEGSKERECSVCGYKATETIAKLDHAHAKGTKHEVVAATCTAKGNIEYYDCTNGNCTEKLDADGNVLAAVETEKDASNHSGIATTWTKTETTHKETYNCCGAVKTEESAHTFGDWVSNGDATKEADGTHTKTCTACGYEVTETDVGSKLPDELTMTNAGGNTLSTADLGEPSEFTVNGQKYYAYNAFISKTSGSNWQNAMDFVNLLNENHYGGHTDWMLINDASSDGSAIGNAWKENYSSTERGAVDFLWSSVAIDADFAIRFNADTGVCDSRINALSTSSYGFLVLRGSN